MPQPNRRDAIRIAASAISIPVFFRHNDAFGSGIGAFGSGIGGWSSQEPTIKPTVESGVAWFDVSQWPVEGKGWAETLKPFDRLPAKAETLVRKPVWDLSRDSAGMATRFATNAPEIKVRYELTSGNLAMSHMPATGVSGVDLYADDAGVFRWLNVSRPTKQTVDATLASDIHALPGDQQRNFMLYLPLYNGVEKLEIGIPENLKFTSIAARDKPILFYGTSIMHGACASRPGMSISAILGRRFDRAVTNLGFSGNGTMDLPLADLIGELDPCVIAIDCLPNMSSQQVGERTEPFVKRVRELHPTTPILLVEDRSFTNARFFKARREQHQARRQNLKNAFDQLTQNGVQHLHYLDGENLLGDDGNGATDGSHPSDLGMMRYADAYETALRAILG